MSALLIAAAGAALVAQADDANERYVSCMFSVAREQPRDAPTETLAALLYASCERERELARTSALAAMRERGVADTEAVADWDAAVENGIANIALARSRVRTATR